MESGKVNVLAVIVTGIIVWLMGALWYSPLLFASRWIAYVGNVTPQSNPYGNLPYAIALLSDFVMAYVLACLILRVQATNGFKGAGLGILLWIGFVGPASLSPHLFEGRPLGLFLIESGYPLAGMMIAGAILATWKRRTTPAQ
jgi:hypothetical protein